MGHLSKQERLDETPLHIATRLRLLEMVALLFQHGADPCLQTTDGFTPFMHAVALEKYPLEPKVEDMLRLFDI